VTIDKHEFSYTLLFQHGISHFYIYIVTLNSKLCNSVGG